MLGLSQEQFARRFNLDLDALQNWEQGRRSPDRTVLSYLRVIAAAPETAARAQEVASCFAVQSVHHTGPASPRTISRPSQTPKKRAARQQRGPEPR
ncbi:MAG TPA: helix-turn-helix domain-containing protein [Hyphomicrobiaceae bacterium]|nr:helix-turn-helix domain-containing protein [Hyphomicrobiaceae bacterium]